MDQFVDHVKTFFFMWKTKLYMINIPFNSVSTMHITCFSTFEREKNAYFVQSFLQKSLFLQKYCPVFSTLQYKYFTTTNPKTINFAGFNFFQTIPNGL